MVLRGVHRGAGLRGHLPCAEADLIAERVQTARDERGWFSSPAGIALLWTGILAGPIAWAIDLTSSYAIVKWTCGNRHPSVPHPITLAALLITAAGGPASWRALQRAPGDAAPDGPRPIDRGRFMAILGLAMDATFALATIANTVPRVLLDACS